MQNNSSDKTSIKDRVCLRAPVKLPAEIYAAKCPYKKVVINDISTTGLSFSVDDMAGIPEVFEMRFKLPGSREKTELAVKIKNKVSVPNAVRIGCVVSRITEKNKKLIENYISKFLNFSGTWLAVKVAAFFLFVDALVRMFAYFIDVYYAATPFGKSAQAGALSAGYGGFLLIYAAVCFTVLIMNDDVLKKNFLLRMSGIVVAFVFIFIKFIASWKMCLWQDHYMFIRGLFWAETALVVCTLIAIVIGVVFMGRRSYILDSFSRHQTGNQQRNVQV